LNTFTPEANFGGMVLGAKIVVVSKGKGTKSRYFSFLAAPAGPAPGLSLRLHVWAYRGIGADGPTIQAFVTVKWGGRGMERG